MISSLSVMTPTHVPSAAVKTEAKEVSTELGIYRGTKR